VLRGDSAGGWKNVGGLIWGQDETNVVEDLVSGWEPERDDAIAEGGGWSVKKTVARL
jgi:hypothetical protein